MNLAIAWDFKGLEPRLRLVDGWMAKEPEEPAEVPMPVQPSVQPETPVEMPHSVPPEKIEVPDGEREVGVPGTVESPVLPRGPEVGVPERDLPGGAIH